MTSDIVAGPGTRVTMHFSLSLESGAVIDSNFDGDPATFVYGDGNLMPGFEDQILGMEEGETKEVLILPDIGFGQPNPDNIQEVKRSEFPENIELEIGLMLSFADAQSHERPGVIVDFNAKSVTVDFNHPLAGKNIVFKVQIVSIEPTVTH